MRKQALSIIICLLSVLILCAFSACNDSTQSEEMLAEEKARAKSPLLGQWISTTEANDRTVTVTVNFNQDGTVTSTHEDGTNAFALFESVTWTYDTENEQLTMDYVDIKGAETSSTFKVNVSSENYITLLPQNTTSSPISKLVLTR